MDEGRIWGRGYMLTENCHHHMLLRIHIPSCSRLQSTAVPDWTDCICPVQGM